MSTELRGPVAGQLDCLSATDLYMCLSQEHEATMVGVLLGVAVAKRGTMDGPTSKMLFLHVPARSALFQWLRAPAVQPC